jgi:ribulose kinase
VTGDDPPGRQILWIKQHLPDAFARVTAGGKFLDLADYLTYRAADYARDVRSLCTVVCKWSYDENAAGTGIGFDQEFLHSIGFNRGLRTETIGSTVAPPGTPIDGGLGAVAAAELGLHPGTPLAVGMIDAHAGGIGCLGATLPGDTAADPPAQRLASRMALIAGTSACHMASSAASCFVPGIWGPYWNAMVHSTAVPRLSAPLTSSPLRTLPCRRPAST